MEPPTATSSAVSAPSSSNGAKLIAETDIVVFSLVRSFRRRAGARSRARWRRPLARAVDRDVEIRVDLLDREGLAAELEVDPAPLVDAAAGPFTSPTRTATRLNRAAKRPRAKRAADRRGRAVRRQPQIAAADVELYGIVLLRAVGTSVMLRPDHDAGNRKIPA
jgi:hypothetical protein